MRLARAAAAEKLPAAKAAVAAEKAAAAKVPVEKAVAPKEAAAKVSLEKLLVSKVACDGEQLKQTDNAAHSRPRRVSSDDIRRSPLAGAPIGYSVVPSELSSKVFWRPNMSRTEAEAMLAGKLVPVR